MRNVSNINKSAIEVMKKVNLFDCKNLSWSTSLERIVVLILLLTHINECRSKDVARSACRRCKRFSLPQNNPQNYDREETSELTYSFMEGILDADLHT